MNTVIEKNATILGMELGEAFKQSAQAADGHTFVRASYERLKQEKIFSALVPDELGGLGWSHHDMCLFLNQLAQGCSSTALALSMHQHLVSANVWKYRKGQGAEALLKKIANEQLVLVSTGAGDWLSSTGEMKRVEGGYVVTARKHFASGSPAGNLLVTSARFTENDKTEVLHFGIPFSSKGVQVEDNWRAMGMRGTGSVSVTLTEVFVPEASVSLRRAAGEFHPFWNVVLTVAMPLIMSVYVGIAEKAAALALQHAGKKQDAHTPFLLGEMFNALTTARVMWHSMMGITNNFDFQPVNENGNEILMRKTTVAAACIETVTKASELMGGQSYLEQTGMERLYRDVLASNFHPLPEKEQHLFTGNYYLGNTLFG
jgi:alkylation response protein AidB-like acyl-CoA dehydrogenase